MPVQPLSRSGGGGAGHGRCSHPTGYDGASDGGWEACLVVICGSAVQECNIDI